MKSAGRSPGAFKKVIEVGFAMAKKSRTAVLKRQREVKKAEKAAMKREKREIRGEAVNDGSHVATTEDLAGYGFGDGEEAEAEDTEAPAAAS